MTDIVKEKQGLRARRKALESLWQQGLSGKALLQAHTQLIDAHLQEKFSGCDVDREQFSIVALGGYGRGELCPFSDIDLMILHVPGAEEDLGKVAEAIFYPLWDSGLEVGHAVRTPQACIDDAGKDFFFQVAMLDSRLVAGSLKLFSSVRELFRQTFIEGKRQEFLEQMLYHKSRRHEQYGMHSYLLEPHVKEIRGGLRDIQALLWTAEVVFGLRGTAALEDAGILSSEERLGFDAAWDQLIRIRNRLHYISGRKNDQLFFEHQEDMAAAFEEYRAADGILEVEHFMRDVYGHLRTVAITTELFFEHVDDVLGLTRYQEADRVLEDGIEVRHGRIHLTSVELLREKPALMMRVFAQAAKTGLNLHQRTKKIIHEHLYLIDEKSALSRRMTNPFVAVLQQTETVAHVLEGMMETGLLGALIPEFTAIESLAQHDVYHVYTVDSHLLQTVAQLKELRQQEVNIFQEVSSLHVLCLAALLHDIGKGQGGDHSEIGAQLVEKIGGRLGLGPEEIACLVFLVRHHLFLTATALRRDLEDESLIERCAKTVGERERLAMLYLLSVADAKATGPMVWNEWKAALLLELYLKTVHMLERHDAAGVNRAQGVEWMRQKVADLLPKSQKDEVAGLPDDYLISFSPQDVVQHLSSRAKLAGKDIIIFPEKRKGFWSILLLANDRAGLLTRVCGVFALHNLNVLTAQIFTWPDGTVVDVLEVNSTVSEEYESQDWAALAEDLNRAVKNRLGLTHRLGRKLLPSRRIGSKVNKRKTKVIIDNKTSEEYSVIEVYSEDRAGLLYDITRTLTDFGINIYRAKIARQAEQLVDVFYVRDAAGCKIMESDFLNEIQEGLLYAVNAG
jgi:[protein-PII] uridylyltransferase